MQEFRALKVISLKMNAYDILLNVERRYNSHSISAGSGIDLKSFVCHKMFLSLNWKYVYVIYYGKRCLRGMVLYLKFKTKL